MQSAKRPSPDEDAAPHAFAPAVDTAGQRPKRKRTTQSLPAGPTEPGQHDRPVSSAFAKFAAELDRFQDRRERLIKISRDVTALSKKLIFHLHRWQHPDVDLHPAADDGKAFQSVESQALVRGKEANAKLLATAHQKLDEIVNMLKDAARNETLGESHTHDRVAASSSSAEQRPAPIQDDSDAKPVHLSHRYDRAFGPGLEEFIEALSFMHFLENDAIITLTQVQSYFLNDAPPSSLQTEHVLLRVTPERYALGLSDLTGELMRYATNALASPAAQKARVVPRTLEVLRLLADQLDPFSSLIWEFQRKQRVTIQSLRKIEQLSYSLTVRSIEFGSDPGTLAEIVRRALAAGNTADPAEDGAHERD
ncbi:hypothetical protein OC845_003460 [Tilletia horrida]|nr:hypothetical protein OC845_003460 [Tilletia horrida]